MGQNKFNLNNSSLFDSQGLIAGSWKSAPEGKTFQVSEPSTGDVLADCANFGKQDFLEAVESAHGGFQKFHSSTTAKERGVILRHWNDLILQNVEDCKIQLWPFSMCSGTNRGD